MTIIEQRFLRGPNLWSSHSCLHAVLDLGSLQGALSCDVPCFTDALLDLLPGLHVHAAALRRGCFLAEVVGMVMLEVQRLAGTPCESDFAATVMGRAGRCRLIVASPSQEHGQRACAIALALVAELADAARRSARPIRIPALRQRPAPPHARLPAPHRSLRGAADSGPAHPVPAR